MRQPTSNRASSELLASSSTTSPRGSVSPFHSRDLNGELTCAICHQLFVCARTAECGHSFCRSCIGAWLAQNATCPTCRSPIVNPPVKSVSLDRAVECALTFLNCPLMQRSWTERKQECELQLSGECVWQEKLQSLFSRAQQCGVQTVHISRVWSPAERARFQCGISKHVGLGREAYCNLVGLSSEWIAEAPYESLVIAAANVQVPRPPGMADWKPACLRRRLEMYLRYG